MSEASAPAQSGDASRDEAWVSIPVPFPPERLARYCSDIEAVFRVNPYYTFHEWRQTGAGRYAVDVENHSNQTRTTLQVETSDATRSGLTVNYTGGIKRRTMFRIEPASNGSRLTITDDYQLLPEAERAQRIGEVDKSLNAWGGALRVYFLRLHRWSWLPGWNWYIRRVWMPMKPSARRIVWFLYLITAAEFVFFLFVLLIWRIEYG